MNPLALLFLSEVRSEVFRVLFCIGAKRMYRAQIVGLIDYAPSSVEEELAKLVRLELLLTTTDGNRRYYEANQAHPLYPELRSIVLKTVGLRDVLVEALPADRITYAFVFGSLAAQTATAASDVDLMIIGDAGHRELASALRAVGEKLSREINPHFFGIDEFLKRSAAKDHFLGDVLAKPKLFVLGDEHEFNDMVGRRLAPTA
jgi:predicted nucleotidyltransferase